MWLLIGLVLFVLYMPIVPVLILSVWGGSW